MSSIKKELNKLAEKVGAPVNGKNISEQIASINVHLEGTSHGANISERINEFREAWGGGDNPPILKNKTITENGTYNAIDDQADGYKKVDVEVPPPVLMNKTVTPTTSEQTITADEGYDALGTVTVEAVTATIDNNITAGNIKKDVQILGVTGSYEGSSGEYNATLTPEGTEFNYNNDYTSLLTAITIPSSVTSIGNYAFDNCTNLITVIIPSSVTSIGEYAFDNCSSLITVTISEGVETIGDSAFNNCPSLTAITIPSSVTSIGSNAFYDCTDLATITIHKAEGSITGAPWGAPNATVIWDG